ncbi:E3 ubiquitin-protein ligase [Canna indica]|uniref:E3 ubiquitin-protein ligase n=1 Tax=Canna indica TaxID=4628 RepID=A0AAQ3JSY8_9LILI|nr:E3 ubiquitin-protein ligase [Canna indica]
MEKLFMDFFIHELSRDDDNDNTLQTKAIGGGTRRNIARKTSQVGGEMQHSMSISMEYFYSGVLVTRLFSKVAMLLSLVVRWLLLPCCCSWWPTSSPSPSADDVAASHSAAAQAVRDGLRVATYGEIAGAAAAATCAVCLNEVRRRDSVWELANCAHVFHKGCLDRWLDHDERLTCPLCRVQLLSGPSFAAAAEHSWAVERLAYLFGDDLLSSPAQ